MGKFKLFIKKVCNSVKKCYDAVYNKIPYIEPALIISGSLLVALVIIVSVKGIVSEDVVKFESNPAEVAFYNNDYEAAITEYEKMQKESDWPFWDVKIAEVYSIEGRIEKSNQLLSNILIKRNEILSNVSKEKYEKDYKEKDSELINYIVFTYFMNEEYKAALSVGEEFIEKYGENKELIKTVYTVYMVDGQKDKAKDILDKYDVDKESAYDLAVLAEMNILASNWDNGFTLLKEAFNKDKNEIKSIDVISQLAKYDRQGILEKVEKLINDNPDELVYKMWIANIYAMTNETANEAIEIIEKIENDDIGTVPVNIIKLNAYRNLGNDEEAESALEKIIDNNKNSYIGYYMSAWQSFNKKDYDKALELSKNSILENRNYSNNYGILIPEIMMAKEKSEVSESYFRTALQKEPFNYTIMIKMAEYYADKTTQNEKVRKYYNLAASLVPNSAEIYYKLAMIDELETKREDAIKNMNKAIEINELDSKYYRTLGTLYFEEKEYDKAIENIRNAYAIDEDNGLTLNNAGIYYIVVEEDILRGMENIQAAYDSITSIMDDDIKAKISKNYNRAKNIYDNYNSGNEIEIKASDFELFY